MENEREGTAGAEIIAPGWVSMMFAILLLIVGAVLAGYGLNETFSYADTDKLVGGDAFNLQILATRGVALIGAGIVLAIGAVVHALISVRAAILHRK